MTSASSMTGSFGTLAVLAEATIKVLPAPEASRTLCLAGLDDAAAAVLMNKALGGAAGCLRRRSFAARDCGAGARWAVKRRPCCGWKALRSPSTTGLASCRRMLAGEARVLGEEAAALWRSIRDAAFFAEDAQRRALARCRAAGRRVQRDARPRRSGALFLRLGRRADLAQSSGRQAMAGRQSCAAAIRRHRRPCDAWFAGPLHCAPRSMSSSRWIRRSPR